MFRTITLLIISLYTFDIYASTQPIITYVQPGRSRSTSPPAGLSIEVELPQDISTTLSKKTFSQLKNTYIDTFEKKVKSMRIVEDSFFDWLAKKPEIREAFFVALDPVYDNIPNACKILYSLHTKHGKKTDLYFHLAIAIAVVWDDEDAIQSSRFRSIWGFSSKQFPEHLSYEGVFEFFTSPRALKVAVFKPNKLRWPLLVHVVDYDLTNDEINWALKSYYKKRKDLSGTYREIKYDNQKITSKSPRIGKRDYTLQNIKAYDGICGDQAHYTSRLSKTFSIPSMKVNGKGRYGGAHAWAGYLVVKKSVPLLEFTGRFRGDMYYTGFIFDPQKRSNVLDRSVQQMFAAVSKKYEKFIDTLIAQRIYTSVGPEHKEVRHALMKYALKRNPLSAYSWEMVKSEIDGKNLATKEVLKKLSHAVSVLRGYPDAVLDIQKTVMNFLASDDTKVRQKIYTKVYKLLAKRPDLQIKLLLEQCKELAAMGKSLEALTLSMNCCLKNAEESRLILPLVELAVAIIKEHGLQKQAAPSLQKIDKLFPKKRGRKPSRSYGEFRTLIESL